MITRALEKMGDERAITVLEEFAENPFRGTNTFEEDHGVEGMTAEEYYASEVPIFRTEIEASIKKIRARSRR